MPRIVTQYRVFIGSPGGLDDERKTFRDKLGTFTATHSEPEGLLFHPVGWEETIGGVGRPQALINEDLKRCDFAVFVLHNRWGSPTGDAFTSGVEEEWSIAEELYNKKDIRNIALFFKAIDPAQLADPGKQLAGVLAFKQRIEEGKRYLFKQYESIDQFTEALDAYLAQWKRDHLRAPSGLSLGPSGTDGAAKGGGMSTGATIVPPNFDYWIAEAGRSSSIDGPPDYNSALFCATKAIGAAQTDIEWARACNAKGIALASLDRPGDATAEFTAILDRFANSIDADRRCWQARALGNKGFTLGTLGRSEEAIAVYDDLLGRFGASPELPLREQVARALFNKGVTLGTLGRSEEAIAVYDDVLGRFGASPELPLREQVAKALFNKGVTLGTLGRSEEEVAVYDDLLGRFGASPELPLRELER